ncbi:MAG: hypothetical protein ABI658_03555 [Acidimicrobiales bacterium]
MAVALAVLCSVAIVTGHVNSHVVIRLFVLVPLVLYATVGQQMRVRRRLRRTIYVLTDSRLLILTRDNDGLRTYAPRLDLLPLVTFVRRGGSRGDIVLGDRQPGFYDLADVDTPLRIVRARHPNVRERTGR